MCIRDRLNDDLNGTERPVAFNSYELNNDDEIEIIHSLAKWKRDGRSPKRGRLVDRS